MHFFIQTCSFLPGLKQRQALRIHLKVNKGKIHCSSFPQFIVVEHLKVLFWRDAQTRNISLRVRFDLVIEFYGHFTYSAVHLHHLQHLTARGAHMSKCISIPQGLSICNNVGSRLGKQDSRPRRDQEKQLAAFSCC